MVREAHAALRIGAQHGAARGARSRPAYCTSYLPASSACQTSTSAPATACRRSSAASRRRTAARPARRARCRRPAPRAARRRRGTARTPSPRCARAACAWFSATVSIDRPSVSDSRMNSWRLTGALVAGAREELDAGHPLGLGELHFAREVVQVRARATVRISFRRGLSQLSMRCTNGAGDGVFIDVAHEELRRWRRTRAVDDDDEPAALVGNSDQPQRCCSQPHRPCLKKIVTTIASSPRPEQVPGAVVAEELVERPEDQRADDRPFDAADAADHHHEDRERGPVDAERGVGADAQVAHEVERAGQPGAERGDDVDRELRARARRCPGSRPRPRCRGSPAAPGRACCAGTGRRSAIASDHARQRNPEGQRSRASPSRCRAARSGWCPSRRRPPSTLAKLSRNTSAMTQVPIAK